MNASFWKARLACKGCMWFISFSVQFWCLGSPQQDMSLVLLRSQASFSVFSEFNSLPSTPAEPRQPCPTPQEEGSLCQAGTMPHGDVPGRRAAGAAPSAAHGQLSVPVMPRGPNSATWPWDHPGCSESHRLSLPACRLQQVQAAAFTFFIPSRGSAALQVRINELKLTRWRSSNLHVPADFQARLHPALPIPMTAAVSDTSEREQSFLLGGGWRTATW